MENDSNKESEEETKGDENELRRKYTRCQMEALRFAQQEYQLEMFNRVYCALEPNIKRDFDSVLNKKNNGNRSNNNQRNNRGRRGFQQEMPLTTDTSNQSGIGEISDKFENMQCEEDDDISDDSSDGILKPALYVEGEPDFESGPPADGWEYLRRVRWEANQLPDVRVAKLNLTEICAEQTPYMPQMPDLPKCPPNLLSSKNWEHSFLDDFSQLRQAFSKLDSSVDPSDCSSRLKSSIENRSQIIPTVSTILNMDVVSRAATLRNYIDMSESMERMSKHDCLWLFALCATVDMPLHANTCASLRCLLRKCLGILATKSEMDDEVAMLSVLVSICGKFFGQYDNTYVESSLCS